MARFRRADAKRLRRLEVDGELDSGGLLDRQVCWLLALDNAADIVAGQAVSINNIAAIADEPAGLNKGSSRADRRYSMSSRKRGEPFVPADKKGITEGSRSMAVKLAPNGGSVRNLARLLPQLGSLAMFAAIRSAEGREAPRGSVPRTEALRVWMSALWLQYGWWHPGAWS